MYLGVRVYDLNVTMSSIDYGQLNTHYVMQYNIKIN